jgi:hypothetical protein
MPGNSGTFESPQPGRYISHAAYISRCICKNYPAPARFAERHAVTSLTARRPISRRNPLQHCTKSVATLRQNGHSPFRINGLRAPPVDSCNPCNRSLCNHPKDNRNKDRTLPGTQGPGAAMSQAGCWGRVGAGGSGGLAKRSASVSAKELPVHASSAERNNDPSPRRPGDLPERIARADSAPKRSNCMHIQFAGKRKAGRPLSWGPALRIGLQGEGRAARY